MAQGYQHYSPSLSAFGLKGMGQLYSLNCAKHPNPLHSHSLRSGTNAADCVSTDSITTPGRRGLCLEQCRCTKEMSAELGGVSCLEIVCQEYVTEV